MIVFPNCKINLGLRILNKREDGYHNLATIFYPVPLKDALEIIPSNGTDPVQFTGSGLSISGSADNNLCIKAYRLLKKDFPSLPPVKIHLHKSIPMGAGLGGGSADAAFTLQVLNDQLKLNLSTSQLKDYALQLGSDCPFFILNTPCIALNLSAYNILLINPGIHVNTAEAFAALNPPTVNTHLPSLTAIINQPINTWQQFLKNDFEQPVFQKYPVIKEIKETLYQMGASYASMTGSGSTIFGLFEKHLHPTIHFDTSFFVRQLSL
jgi:4-diphosphocytidyl-2-C-methyl-D-erythritol kinase